MRRQLRQQLKETSRSKFCDGCRVHGIKRDEYPVPEASMVEDVTSIRDQRFPWEKRNEYPAPEAFVGKNETCILNQKFSWTRCD
jgi:hypothetical protein